MSKKKIIPYGKQNITEEDIVAVSKALVGDYLTQGPLIKEFEEHFANYVDAKFAVAVTNGTAALHISALALSIKPGDKVSVPVFERYSGEVLEVNGDEVKIVVTAHKNRVYLDK